MINQLRSSLCGLAAQHHSEGAHKSSRKVYILTSSAHHCPVEFLIKALPVLLRVAISVYLGMDNCSRAGTAGLEPDDLKTASYSAVFDQKESELVRVPLFNLRLDCQGVSLVTSASAELDL